MTPSTPALPFLTPRRPPGASPLDLAGWLGVDPDYPAQMALRDRLVAEPPESLGAMLPGAEGAVREITDTVLDWLARDGRWQTGATAIRRPDGVSVPRDGEALPLLGRLVQEDILLLAPGEPEYRLVAGVLCFPSRWHLADKLGRPLTAIHGPVPGYAGDLAARVNRLFAALRPETPLVRWNWLVHPTDTLRQALREGERSPLPDGRAGWFLRTERQGLRRLPQSGAVAFTIKTTVTPVATLTAPQRQALGAALAGWGADEIAYRGGEAVWRGALAAVAG